MELTAILRVLARRWKAVVVGAIAAVAVGLSVAGFLPAGPGSATDTRRGIAESKVLVNTRSSYAGDLQGGTEALAEQAALLATLIADDPQRKAIARQAGIGLDQLDVLVGGITEPKIPSTLARTLSESVDRPRLPFAVTVRADSSVSIIAIQTAAPTRAEAAELARAATAALTFVATDSAPSEARALVVEPLGRVRSLEVVESGASAPLIAIAATIALFGFWCCGVVILTGLARVWRNAASASASAG